eukprot:9273565-Pyramimonas_sp.AAC.1
MSSCPLFSYLSLPPRTRPHPHPLLRPAAGPCQGAEKLDEMIARDMEETGEAAAEAGEAARVKAALEKAVKGGGSKSKGVEKGHAWHGIFNW